MHEIKRDGNCSLLVIQDGRVRAFTRNGFDWTDRYSRVVDCAARLPCWSAVLDGEIIVQDERGLSDFGALRRAMAREIFGEADPLCPIQFCEAVEGDGAAVFAAADRMAWKGSSRRERLAAIEVGRARPGSRLSA